MQPLCRFWAAGGGFRESRPYDLWSVGIVWLELILGTPHVFSISDRMKARLHQALHLDEQKQVGKFQTLSRLMQEMKPLAVPRIIM